MGVAPNLDEYGATVPLLPALGIAGLKTCDVISYCVIALIVPGSPLPGFPWLN